MFYSLSPKFSNSPVCLFNEDLSVDLGLKLLHGDTDTFDLPISFKHVSGHKYTDFLNPGGFFSIVSEKVTKLLEENNITGWKTFPIKAKHKNGSEINGYIGLSITGKTGKFDKSQSEIIRKRTVENGPEIDFYKGLYFDMTEWDGNDLFIPKETAFFIMTKKVYEVFKKNKISNVNLKPTDKIEISCYTILDK